MEEKLLNRWRELSDALFAFVLKRVGNKEDAEDILQNVYIKLHKNIASLRDEEKLTSWMYQITRNTINECYKKCYRIKTTEFEDIHNDEVSLSCCEEENLNEEILKVMLSFIDLLPEHYKEILELFELKKLSHKEIALKLNISENTSKSRVKRGKEKLKNLLDSCCIFETDKYGNIINYKKK